MKEIQLTKGTIALIDDEDFERVSKHSWSYKDSGSGYAQTTIRYKGVSLHRFIMNAKDGEIIDHINGNGLDNRKENLRFCTLSQNIANSKGRLVRSSYKGVSKNGKKWKASIGYMNRLEHIGTFDIAQDAARAYDEKAREYYKEFARTNF